MQRLLLVLAMLFVPVSGTIVHAEPPEAKPTVSAKEMTDFQARLTTAATKHLEALLEGKARVTSLKGKSADGTTALAYYQMFELTGNQKFREAALTLADRIVKDMRATKHGVLYIKEKDKGGGESIAGGGPPAFGWYTTAAMYIFRKEGGHNDDIKYIATIIDKFPWNESGWWANTIDIKTGEPKEPLTKAGAINKNAAMALCAAVAADCLKDLDPALAKRLKAKAETCITKQVIPAQEADGFWHYGFTGHDPNNKDVIGYFMVTSNALVELQLHTDMSGDRAFQAALEKACGFALRDIAPMTDPNPRKTQPSKRASGETPMHYDLARDTKRGFELGPILFAGKNDAEGIKIMDEAIKHFAIGNAGTDGAHAIGPTATILTMLHKRQPQAATEKK